MDIFLVNQDNPHAKGLMDKLSNQSAPGAIIPLLEGEIDLYNSKNDFRHVFMGGSKENMVEVEPGKSYICYTNPDNENIQDIIGLSERLNIIVGIVRCRD